MTPTDALSTTAADDKLLSSHFFSLFLFLLPIFFLFHFIFYIYIYTHTHTYIYSLSTTEEVIALLP